MIRNKKIDEERQKRRKTDNKTDGFGSVGGPYVPSQELGGAILGRYYST